MSRENPKTSFCDICCQTKDAKLIITRSVNMGFKRVCDTCRTTIKLNHERSELADKQAGDSLRIEKTNSGTVSSLAIKALKKYESTREKRELSALIDDESYLNGCLD